MSSGIRRKVVEMEEEYKSCIAKLEFKETVTPPEQRKARLAELKVFSATIALCLEDTQKFLEDTNSTWAAIKEIDDLVDIHVAL